MTRMHTLPWMAALVALYAAAVYLPFLGSSRTLTSHEVMVTQPALRMLEGGPWIVPKYASNYWLDKPPLANWLTAACFAVAGGFSETAARLPAALSAIGLCVLMTVLAGRFFSTRVALLSGLVQATAVYMYTQGRLGEIDIVFAILITAAHGVLLWHWGRGETTLPWPSGILFHVLAGLAVLTKGPVAVALLGATVLVYCLWCRSWRPLRVTVFTPGILVFILIAGGWHVAAYVSVGHEALAQWNRNSMLRFFGLHHLGAQSLFLYFWSIPWLVLPWTIALVVGALRLWAGIRGPDAAVHRFLWSWFLGGLALLTVSLFKSAHYADPILPPLSILTAIVLDEHIARTGVRGRRFYTGVFAACLVTFWVVGGYILPWRDHRRPTAKFVAQATASVPRGETLYVIGLGQSAVYPYIAHQPCDYVDDPNGVAAIFGSGARPIWVFSLQQHLKLAERYGFKFEEKALEPPRPKLDLEGPTVLGLLSPASPSTSATSTTTSAAGTGAHD